MTRCGLVLLAVAREQQQHLPSPLLRAASMHPSVFQLAMEWVEESLGVRGRRYTGCYRAASGEKVS